MPGQQRVCQQRVCQQRNSLPHRHDFFSRPYFRLCKSTHFSADVARHQHVRCVFNGLRGCSKQYRTVGQGKFQFETSSWTVGAVGAVSVVVVGGECTFQCTTNVQQGARQTNKSHQRWVGAVAAVNSKRKRRTKRRAQKNEKENKQC